jgi:MFS family permease
LHANILPIVANRRQLIVAKQTPALGVAVSPTSKSSPGHFRWVIVATLCAVALVLYVDRINIAIAAPHIAHELGLSPQALGRVLSAFLFGYALGLVPGGWLADRFGAYRVLAAAGVVWAILTLLIACIPGVRGTSHSSVEALLVVARFALGLAEACAYPAFARALANWMRHGERAVAIGLVTMGSNVGGVLTPLLISWIIGRSNWRYSFLLSAIITLAVILCWSLIGSNEPETSGRVSANERLFIALGRGEDVPVKPDRGWYRRMARSREVYLLCASCFFLGISGFVFVTWFYTYFVEVRGASSLYSAVTTSMTYLTAAVGALAGGILCDVSVRKWGAPWGRRLVPLAAMTVSGVVCIVAPLIRDNNVSAILFSLAAGLQVVPAPAFWATVMDVTRRGPALVGGLMNGSGNLGAALGTIVFPWLVSEVGWQLALQIAGSTGIVCGLIWLLIDSSRQIDAATPTPFGAPA